MKTSERWVLRAPSLTQGGAASRAVVASSRPHTQGGSQHHARDGPIPWLHPAQPKARSLPCRGAVLGRRGHSLSPGWVPLEKLVGPPLGTRALVIDGPARVDPVEWTLFFAVLRFGLMWDRSWATTAIALPGNRPG